MCLSPVYELALDHVFANPNEAQQIPTDAIQKFEALFATEDILDELGFHRLHQTVLGLIEGDLRFHWGEILLISTLQMLAAGLL